MAYKHYDHKPSDSKAALSFLTLRYMHAVFFGLSQFNYYGVIITVNHAKVMIDKGNEIAQDNGRKKYVDV